MHAIKKFFLLLILTGVLFSSAEAKSTPSNILLVFEDRILTLNFRTNPDLLIEKPSHIMRWNGLDVPVVIDEELPEIDELISIETRFKTEVSKEKLKQYFENASISLKREQKPVEVRFDDFGNIIFDGGSPEGGFEVDYDRLVTLINKSLEEENEFVRVPATKKYSQVVVHPDLAERGIKEIIAVGESNFTGSSPARRQNILAASNKFNGYILKQGKTFSFNTILESVEEKDGFVKELVIKGNETVKELGGGVCQVSTTVFRAAFNGGLPIVNRRNHSYAVPYYHPFGLDAMIYLGSQDFKFRNDTPGDILIQSYIKNSDIYFVFYGTKDERKIQLEGPFISNYREAPDPIIFETEDLPWGEEKVGSEAHDGFRSEWVRHVIKDGKKETENIISNYRPWPAKVVRGIGGSPEEATLIPVAAQRLP